MENLVSTQWLAEQLGAGDLRVVDATRHHFEAQRNARAEYEAGHIPGALFLDMPSLFDPASPVENTAPTAEQFSRRMRELGLERDQRIVIYDESIVKTAARAWFLFKAYGLPNVAMLDGGLAKWKAEGRPVEPGVPTVQPSAFAARIAPDRFRSKAQVLANIATLREQLVDGRGVEHFSGEHDDPQPGIAAGHIPGARNVPFWDLFNADGTFKPREELRALFAGAGVDLSRPVVTSCGGGVVACALALALDQLGKGDVALYDGSWSEWGADPALPRETGRTPA
ncbi:MAG TPA: 3-mercaptopyruvate sulfurtransferase [Novosphingobium sp.]|nr:3-mercaptopyruvate sulfurtransferase [Novosphingobium sp.]